MKARSARSRRPKVWRRLHGHDLLTFLASRTYQDHWYLEDVDKGGRPYYDAPAFAYASAAKELARGPLPTKQAERDTETQRLQTASNLGERVKKAFPVAMAPITLTPASWTTERSYPLTWKIDTAAELPDGLPMTWEDLRDGSSKGVADGKARSERRPFLDKDRAQPVVSTPLAGAEKPEVNQTKTVRLNLLYRGQRRVAEIEVKAYDPSLVVQRLEPPSTARLAVRMAKGLKYGALSIVLDTSGSMGWRHKDEKGNIVNDEKLGDYDKNRRYDYALRALDEVLGKMPGLEYLSMVRFYNSKENSWRGPDRWDAAAHRRVLIEELRDLGKNKKKGPQGEYFEGLNNTSPIAKAIKLSMEEGFPGKPYDGPKVVLVLTDGCDNESFDPANEATPKNTKLVREFLFEASRQTYPGVKVITVCFIKKDDKDYAVAKEQFEPRDALPRNDRFFLTVEDGENLGARIQELLRPRLQMLATDQRDPQQYYINHADTVDWHKLGVARYRGNVRWHQLDDDRPGQQIQFDRGQNMLLTLRRTSLLERGLIATQEESTKRLDPIKMIQPDKDWYGTLYESERRAGKLSQLLFLEKEPGKQGMVTQPRPEMVWLDSSATDIKASPGRIDWGDDFDAAAPAYRLLAQGWASDREAKLSAYWQETFPTDSRLAVRLVGDNVKRVVKVGKTTCEIESIGPETMEDGEKCLTLRVKHEKDKPVWIRLDRWGGENQSKEYTGGWRAGHEHRYFPEVGKYTVRFYPWLDFDPAKAEFVVLCVNSFKEDQERRRAEFVLPPGTDFEFSAAQRLLLWPQSDRLVPVISSVR